MCRVAGNVLRAQDQKPKGEVFRGEVNQSKKRIKQFFKTVQLQ